MSLPNQHRVKNVRVLSDAHEYADGSVRIRFDCSCGMRGDETVGRNEKTARNRAVRICAEHALTISNRVARSLR